MPSEPFRLRFLVAWQTYERALGRKVDRTELADALGVSRPLVTAWEKADAPPPHDRILAIAKLCRVDPGWLAFGEATVAPGPGGGSPGRGITGTVGGIPASREGPPAVAAAKAARKKPAG